MKRILYGLGIAVLAFTSCGEKTFTACDCFEMKMDASVSEADKKWCEAKATTDEAFAKEVRDCGIKSLGHDPSKVNQAEPSKPSAGSYALNTSKSKVKWTGRKAIGQHSGDLMVKSGSYALAEDGSLASGSVVVDMMSLTCTDITDEKDNADLVGHLKNDDFFSVEKFPEASFVLTSSEKLQGSGLKIKGDLTVKGITKPCEGVLAVIPSKNVKGQLTLAGGIKFDRTDYGITYPGMADNLIQDEVSLQLTLVGASK